MREPQARRAHRGLAEAHFTQAISIYVFNWWVSNVVTFGFGRMAPAAVWKTDWDKEQRGWPQEKRLQNQARP